MSNLTHPDLVKSSYKVKAWLEKAEKDGLRRITQWPVPIDLVNETVEMIEQRIVEQRKKKKKPFNIMDQPDDNYDFSVKPLLHSKQAPSKPKYEKSQINSLLPINGNPSRITKSNLFRNKSFLSGSRVVASSNCPSMLDAFDDLKKIFELDDYLHEEDKELTVYKSQPIKISEAKSRLKPPALGPYKKKPYDHVEAKVDTSRKSVTTPYGWQKIPAGVTNVLFKRSKKVSSKKKDPNPEENPRPSFLAKLDTDEKLTSLKKKKKKKIKIMEESSKDPKHVGFAFTHSQIGVHIEESDEFFNDEMRLPKNVTVLPPKDPNAPFPLVKYLAKHRNSKSPALPDTKSDRNQLFEDREFEKIRQRIIEEDKQIALSKEKPSPNRLEIFAANREKSASKRKVKKSKQSEKALGSKAKKSKKRAQSLEPGTALNVRDSGSIAEEYRKLVSADRPDPYNLPKFPKIKGYESQKSQKPKPVSYVSDFLMRHPYLSRPSAVTRSERPEPGLEQLSSLVRPYNSSLVRGLEPQRYIERSFENAKAAKDKRFGMNRSANGEDRSPYVTLKLAHEILRIQKKDVDDRMEKVAKLISQHVD